MITNLYCFSLSLSLTHTHTLTHKINMHTCKHTGTISHSLLCLALYPDLPTLMQSLTHGYFLSHQKAGRSGPFGDVMVMTPGHGLEECQKFGQCCAF